VRKRRWRLDIGWREIVGRELSEDPITQKIHGGVISEVFSINRFGCAVESYGMANVLDRLYVSFFATFAGVSYPYISSTTC
jgi:hypothetical protein